MSSCDRDATDTKGDHALHRLLDRIRAALDAWLNASTPAVRLCFGIVGLVVTAMLADLALWCVELLLGVLAGW